MSLLNKISKISYDRNLKTLAKSHGIDIMNVAWEDTARNSGSCFGPNISDMTLNVDGTNMPIIRKPNFADVSSDKNISDFNVVVGNENGSQKKLISLKSYLENVGTYINNNRTKSMYLERDSKILTTAQTCILPLSNGEVKFNVKLYNYQSTTEPAVLILVCSSEGTSAQIVNGRDCTLYFNKNGKNADFIAERLEDDRKRRGVPLKGEMTNEEKHKNAIFIYQIPLVQKYVRRPTECVYATNYSYGITNSYPTLNSKSLKMFKNSGGYSSEEDCDPDSYLECSSNFATVKQLKQRTDLRKMDNAIIKTSESFGKFCDLSGYELERDAKYPIRCTIQYYKVTDDDEITDSMLFSIAEQINKQYKSVSDDNRGSLVVENTNRITKITSENVYPYNFDGNFYMMENL